jgi:hypothetical protein
MTSYIGSTVSVVSGEPATEDDTGYSALSMTEVSNIISFSPLGAQHSDLSATRLKSGVVKHGNGARDGGEVTIVLDEEDLTDAGRVILEAANGNNTNHSFLIQTPVQKHYFYGLVRNFQTLQGDAGTKPGYQLVIVVNSDFTKVAV